MMFDSISHNLAFPTKQLQLDVHHPSASSFGSETFAKVEKQRVEKTTNQNPKAKPNII